MPVERPRVGHCKRDDCDEYIGRAQGGVNFETAACPGQRGYWGNPFTVDDYDRAASIERFRELLEATVTAPRTEHEEILLQHLKDLEGKTLGCWCRSVDEDAPACHGDVLAAFCVRAVRGEFDASESGGAVA